MSITRHNKTLTVGATAYTYYSVRDYCAEHDLDYQRLPRSIKILIEALLHHYNGKEVEANDVAAMGGYRPQQVPQIEVPFKPARVLLQDFTGVPCVVDLAAMRSAIHALGGDPTQINPEQRVDLIIDHSVQVDYFNSPDAFAQNARLEFERNRERYELLRWGQASFDNFSVVPPASGICHQVNLEYLGQVVLTADEADGTVAYFDSCVGTDSHTPMINGLGVLGWGVGGIEAEAAMLGQPIGMLAPAVVGVELTGRLQTGITATDLVLRVTQMLRQHGVVGKFVEFFGDGLSVLSVPDRATISNMAPEYGATVGYFPVDEQTLTYLYQTGRDEAQIELVREYSKVQGIYREDGNIAPHFESVLQLDLSTVEPALAGPKRPQDRIALHNLASEWQHALRAPIQERGYALSGAQLEASGTVDMGGAPWRADAGAGAGGASAGADDAAGAESATATTTSFELTHGDVVIAAITSCTNTSNPSVLIAAGLVAKHAVERGLVQKPWVKTSFAPGSVVVTEYLKRTGLMHYLEQVGFYLVGYGCTTCIGNSGPLPDAIEQVVKEKELVVAGVLSGNRNFEGRVNPLTKANFLTSPPLVVAYALAGTVTKDLTTEPIGVGSDGKPVYLKELWPSDDELGAALRTALDREEFKKSYDNLERSNPEWNTISLHSTDMYQWDAQSTYIQEPPFFEGMSVEVPSVSTIADARVLVWAGDSVTTDHISPAGAIAYDSPAGTYLQELGVKKEDFNSYGSRRGNDNIMARGTFANIRFRNQLTPDREGSSTIYHPTGEQTDIFSASVRYKEANIPTIVLAGKDYGMGSSRDWAAKGPFLLGVRAVIAESYERIHRSNLIGMGILPLQFMDGQSVASCGLDGTETYTIELSETLQPRTKIGVQITKSDGSTSTLDALCRIDSMIELQYYTHGGILQYVLRKYLK